MSQSASQLEKYNNDPRTPCRYGAKCYQKNKEHLSKFKHPPQSTKRKFNSQIKPSKRAKLNEETDMPKEELSESQDEDTGSTTSSVHQEESKKECISSSGSEQSEEKVERTLEQEPKKECISSSDSEQSEEKLERTLEQEPETAQKESESDKSYQSKEQTESPETKEANNTASSKPFNAKSFIQSRFQLEPPNDFYQFWDFCKQLKPTAPSHAFKDVGLELVGPYDVLAGRFKHLKKSPEEYLQHWRYYYDPPEVFSVIKGNDNTGYHIGYFYDSPDAAPIFLVANHGIKDGEFTKMGENIFAAVNFYLEELKKVGDPFKKMHIGKLQASIKKKAEELNLNLSSHSKRIRERQFKVVAKTFNKIGLVVPYNKKTQLGYRDLAMEDKDLMTLLTRLQKASPEQKSKYLSDLQPVLTYANIALDECDFGTGVKLGWQLLYHGIDSLNSTISQFLGNSYRLLNKEPFANIAEAHMKNRRKSCNLSII